MMTTDEFNDPRSFYQKVMGDPAVEWPPPAPEPDLATIVGKCGDLGIRAIAAMANVSEDDVRRAVAQDDGARGQLAKVRDRLRETFAWGRSGAPTAMEMVTVACDEHHGTKREMLGLLQLLGFDADALPIGNKERLAAELLDKRWVLREDVELPNSSAAIQPPDGWTVTPSWTGGCDVLEGPGESRIRIEPWGFAVIDADGDEAAAGVAAMRCAMAIHERRYGGASDPSTVTGQVLTSAADIERLVLLFYWLTTKMSWHDLLGAIIDSAGVDMDSRGAEALARELVAELLRKNGGHHGLG